MILDFHIFFKRAVKKTFWMIATLMAFENEDISSLLFLQVGFHRAARQTRGCGLSWVVKGTFPQDAIGLI